MHGGVGKADLGNENVEALKKGCANLGRHIENVKQFGVPAVVGINHFVHDTDAEVQAIMDYVAGQGAEAVLCKHWAHGSAGVTELAHKVVDVIEGGSAQFAPLYADEMGLFEKIETVAKRIYRADEVLADKKIRDQLKQWEDDGFGNLPVCMAKTQYSFTTDPTRRGAPNGHSLPIREVRLSAGAGFVVAICGEIMTMPGLPRVPAAESICLNDQGEIEGLF
jgi:formate--tetrahydrofolate ligase